MSSKIFLRLGKLNNVILKRKNYIFSSYRGYTNKNILQLSERGLWADRFPSNDEGFEKTLIHPKNYLTVYAGFDPTAPSLHIGNLLVLMGLLNVQRAGHNVIILIGSGTAMVGDPSGRLTERPIAEKEIVKNNAETIKKSIQNIFKNHKKYYWKPASEKDQLSEPIIVDNIDWYENTNVIDFLRLGKHIPVGRMLSKSIISKRISSNSHLSYAEFSYQCLQAFDWLHLFEKYNCTVQIGGSDQMGNIYAGHDLISRMHETQVTGLTMPLLLSDKGEKLGKSTYTPIYLNAEDTTPFDFYQFFVRSTDNEVGNLMRLFTFLPLNQIKQIEENIPFKPNAAQKLLAEKITLLVHGEKALKSVKNTSRLLYTNESNVLFEMTKEEILSAFKNVPHKRLLLHPGMTLLDLLIQSGMFNDEDTALDLINRGAIYVNKSKVTIPNLILMEGVHILENGLTLLRKGKQHYFLVIWD